MVEGLVPVTGDRYRCNSDFFNLSAWTSKTVQYEYKPVFRRNGENIVLKLGYPTILFTKYC